MKIRARLFISFIIVFLLFTASALFTVLFNHQGIVTAESVQSETLPRAHRLEEIAISIATIQRWVLDSALTGDSFGLDRADQVYGDIRQILHNLDQESDENQEKQYEELRILIDDMYAAGLDMAEEFLGGDEDEAYYLLEDFGMLAEEASDYVEDLRSASSDEVSLGTYKINQNLHFVNRVALIAIVSSILISSLYALYSTSSISRPIEKLSSIAVSIADGNLDQSIPPAKYLEIIHLSSAIKSLINSLGGVIDRIQVVSEDVTSGSDKAQERLTVSTSETQAALTEISSNLESISNQTVSLENMVRELSMSSQLISETADSLEAQVEQQVSVVTQSSASVEQMIRSIENVTKTTHLRSESAKALENVLETGREKLTASAEKADKLSEYIEQMNSITKLISAISGKSGLLSMNAAIEAAHAGKQGMGFAVVADEMRKLSEDTTRNAVLIRDIINQAVSQIQELTDETSLATEAFNAIGAEVTNVLAALLEIDNTMEEMSAGSSEIAMAVSNLSEVSTKVSEATENMKNVSESVESHVTSTESISIQIKQAVSEIGIGTQDVQERINSIFSRVRDVVESIENIHNSVDYFTVGKYESIEP